MRDVPIDDVEKQEVPVDQALVGAGGNRDLSVVVRDPSARRADCNRRAQRSGDRDREGLVLLDRRVGDDGDRDGLRPLTRVERQRAAGVRVVGGRRRGPVGGRVRHRHRLRTRCGERHREGHRRRADVAFHRRRVPDRNRRRPLDMERGDPGGRRLAVLDGHGDLQRLACGVRRNDECDSRRSTLERLRVLKGPSRDRRTAGHPSPEEGSAGVTPCHLEGDRERPSRDGLCRDRHRLGDHGPATILHRAVRRHRDERQRDREHGADEASSYEGRPRRRLAGVPGTTRAHFGTSTK